MKLKQLILEIKIDNPLNFKYKELAKYWGEEKAKQFKERYLSIKKDWEYDPETWEDLKYEEASNILVRVLTDDEAEWAEDFFDYYDELGLGDGDVDNFAKEIADELLK